LLLLLLLLLLLFPLLLLLLLSTRFLAFQLQWGERRGKGTEKSGQRVWRIGRQGCQAIVMQNGLCETGHAAW